MSSFIKAESIKRDTGQEPISVRSLAPVATIKLKATALPKFAGNQRDYFRWRKEWEALQKQGEPTGSKEVKKYQLHDSLDEQVSRDLHLSSYSSSDEIFRVLQNQFRIQATIAFEREMEIVKSSLSGLCAHQSQLPCSWQGNQSGRQPTQCRSMK